MILSTQRRRSVHVLIVSIAALVLCLAGVSAYARQAVTRHVPDGHGVVVIVHSDHLSPPETRAFMQANAKHYWIELENVADGTNHRLIGHMIDETHRIYAGAVPAGRYRNISLGRSAMIAESVLTVRAGIIHDQGVLVFLHDANGTTLDSHWRAADPALTRMRLADYSPGLAGSNLPIDAATGESGTRTAAAQAANEYLNVALVDGAIHVGSSAGLMLVWPLGNAWMDVIDTGLTAPLDIVERFGDGTWLVGGGFMQLARGRVQDKGSWQSALAGLGVGRSLSARLMPDGFVYLLHLEGEELVLYRSADASSPWQVVSRHPASEPWKGNMPRRFPVAALHVSGDRLAFLTAAKTLGTLNVTSGTFETRELPGKPLIFNARADGLLMSLSGFAASWHESADHGRSWTKLGRYDESVNGRLATLVDDVLLRVDLAPGGQPPPALMRSIDQGKTWQMAVRHVQTKQMILNPRSSALVVLFHGRTRLGYSEDAGAHWRETNFARRLR